MVKLERAMGIEPTSSAWEAEVIAIIRRPLNLCFATILQFDGVTSHGIVVEEWHWRSRPS